MDVKPSQAISMITTLLKARLVPIMCGSPGIGKSQLYQQVADFFNLLLIDIRLGQCDVTDLNGFPTIVGKKASYVPMDTFPIEGDAIPAGYSGWLILFDEITSAVPALQAAAYKVLLDRKIGQHKLHKNVAVCAAGNLETDNAVVEPMSTALQSRMVHLELVVDFKEWIDWANTHDINHKITSYINFTPGKLYTFNADHTDKTYACPRTWEFASRILNTADEGSKDLLPLLAGALSEGVAREFLGFCRVYESLPTLAQIVLSPDTIKVPGEPSILFALTGSIAHNANMDNFTQLMKFVERLPVEFQVVCLRESVRRNPTLKAHPAVLAWIRKSAAELF